MTAGPLSDHTVDALADLMRACTGLVFPDARRGDLESGARKIMARAGIDVPSELLDRFGNQPALLDALIDEVTVGETYFFRDAGQFAVIRDVILPEIQALKGRDDILRVWSAGCASGEEAYSLAILLEEIGLGERTQILATDISQAALARGREAVYGRWSLRGDGARLAGRYLTRAGDRFTLADRFRRRVTFAPLNLAQDEYPGAAANDGGQDLILCRNVLIYLDVSTVRAVARHFYTAMASGGYLVVGPSDPLLGDYAPFELLITPAGVLHRKPVAPIRHAPVPVRKSVPSPTPVKSPPPAAVAPMPRPRARVRISAPAPQASLPDSVQRARVLADRSDYDAALTAIETAVIRHPASQEAGFLHAVILLNLQRHTDAERVLKRLLYLDRSLAIAHFTLGATYLRLGKRAAAARAYRNARDIADGMPPDTIVELSENERAGSLAAAAGAHLGACEAAEEASP